MFRTLGHATLKTGERLRIAVLRPPSPRHSGAIRRLLGHKGQPWLAHIDLANEGRADELQTTYTLGLLGRRMVGDVMIVGDGLAGILGHVYTEPSHRRKGICHHLMAAALNRFAADGGRVLSLGTGYDSAAYWIYHSFGFRPSEPGNGHMLYEVRPGEMAACFAPDRARAVDVRWEHWAGVSLLYLQPVGDRVRAATYGVVGPDGFEEGFLKLQTGGHKVGAQAKVLVTPRRCVVGAAMLQPDPRWPGVHALDLFVHPNFQGSEARLLRALKMPRGAKVQALLDRPSTGRVRVLRHAGFRREATLTGQFVRGGKPADILVYSREA